jgi:hypothetical protein
MDQQQRDRDDMPGDFEQSKRQRDDDVKNSAVEFDDDDEFDTDGKSDAETAE